MRKPQDIQDWESWIDQQVRQAQERGEFDDLPGKGRPLDLTANPYARDKELAFKVLKDAGYAPEWIELDKAIRSRLTQARLALTRAWEWREGRLQELADQPGDWAKAERNRVLAGWRRAVTAFEAEVAAINQAIAELNLKVPALRFQRFKVDAAQEVARVEGRLP